MSNATLDQRYESVRKLIWKTVHDFIDRYGMSYGTPDDLFSIGNMGFMVAVRCYDNKRFGETSFPTYVRWVVMKALQDHVRSTARTSKRVSFIDMVENEYPKNPPQFILWEFLEELTEDAKAVVALVLDTPRDLLNIIDENGGSTRMTKSSVRQYLHGQGWSWNRIARSFDEVSAAIG